MPKALHEPVARCCRCLIANCLHGTLGMQPHKLCLHATFDACLAVLGGMRMGECEYFEGFHKPIDQPTNTPTHAQLPLSPYRWMTWEEAGGGERSIVPFTEADEHALAEVGGAG